MTFGPREAPGFVAGAAATGWAPYLDPDEKVLWQGRPDGAVIWKASNLATLVFGLAFAGFALFWMVMASMAGGLFWMFGLLHFLVGLGIAFGPPCWSAFRRRHSWYTLTSRRAFIATDLPMQGRRLTSYPITPETVIGFTDTEPATITFAREMRHGRNGGYPREIGFERISGGRAVEALMRQVQRGAT